MDKVVNDWNEIKGECKKAGIVIKFFEKMADLFQNPKFRRGMGTLGVALSLTGLSACNGKIEPFPSSELTENPKPIETPGEMPSQNVIPTVEVIETPSPTETVGELTESEKMFKLWFESNKKSNGDGYANLVATDAYYKGELDSFIEKNNVSDEDITIMVKGKKLFETFYYPITDNILSDNYNVDDLTSIELVIAIIRGDSVKATGDQLEDAFFALEIYLSFGYTLTSAFPDEAARKDVEKLIDTYYNMVEVKKDLSDFEETFNSYNLDWRQKWYVFTAFLTYPGISPEITYNGETMQLVDYWNYKSPDIMGNFMIDDLQKIFTENYLSSPNDKVDFFDTNVKK